MKKDKKDHQVTTSNSTNKPAIDSPGTRKGMSTVGPLSEPQWEHARTMFASATKQTLDAGDDLIRFVSVMAYANGANDLFDPEKLAATADALRDAEALSKKLENCVAVPPSTVPAAINGAGRTDAEIVAKTEELARALAMHDGYVLESELFHASINPRAQKYWALACVAQELLTYTNPADSLSNLED